MDPMAEEQLDYEDDRYGGSQKMQYNGGGAISALAEDEITGEEDEYDDLYNDVNVGQGFLQLRQSEAPVPSVGVPNGGFQAQKTSVTEPRTVNVVPEEQSIHVIATERKVINDGLRFLEQKEGLTAKEGPDMETVNISQKGIAPDMTQDSQTLNFGFRGSTPTTHKFEVIPVDMSSKVANESVPLLNPSVGVSIGSSQMPSNQMNANVSVSLNVNVNRSIVDDNQIRPPVENGATMLFVGELHWWTTDAELECVLSQYGRVKEIKFFDERASGKSKGYCQVEFYDSTAASACKEGMNGHFFNGRACVVAFASPQTIKQMGASYANKSQVQPPSQPQGRRPMNDGAGRGGGTTYPSGDVGRSFGRGGWGRGGQGVLHRGGGHMRGRGGSIGAKNMVGNTPGVGAGASGGGFGQDLAGPAFGGPAGFMHPQGIMGTGFDPTYMGRGAGYGGFPGPAFHGMLPPFPNVNSMGFGGVAPHVNPAFFGRGMAANGVRMMGNTGMNGPHAGMWTDTSMGGWGGEEHGQRTRESSYGGEDGGSEYGYGETSHDKGVRSNAAASREKAQAPERDWSGNSEKRRHDEREEDRDGYDREHRYRDRYDRERKERDLGYKDNWDRGQASSRSHSRSRVMPEEVNRSRSRDADYGKRRRLPSD